MFGPATPTLQIEEVTSRLTPAPGVSIEQMLHDAQLSGYKSLTIDLEANEAVVVWMRRTE